MSTKSSTKSTINPSQRRSSRRSIRRLFNRLTRKRNKFTRTSRMSNSENEKKLLGSTISDIVNSDIINGKTDIDGKPYTSENLTQILKNLYTLYNLDRIEEKELNKMSYDDKMINAYKLLTTNLNSVQYPDHPDNANVVAGYSTLGFSIKDCMNNRLARTRNLTKDQYNEAKTYCKARAAQYDMVDRYKDDLTNIYPLILPREKEILEKITKDISKIRKELWKMYNNKYVYHNRYKAGISHYYGIYKQERDMLYEDGGDDGQTKWDIIAYIRANRGNIKMTKKTFLKKAKKGFNNYLNRIVKSDKRDAAYERAIDIKERKNKEREWKTGPKDQEPQNKIKEERQQWNKNRARAWNKKHAWKIKHFPGLAWDEDDD